MKKNLLFAAIAITALASCSSNDYVGDQSPQDLGGTNGAISFTSNTQAITRSDATGATAAGHLSNQFIVWGEKNETGENVGTAAGATGRDGDLVFKNYLVDWVDNSAYTTTSNTKGWEYVGLKLDDGSASPVTTDYSSHIHDNSGTSEQTIKYWDYGSTSYTFTAVSALPADITAGDVDITKIQTGTTVYDKGYTVSLTANAHLDNLFFSERQPILASNDQDRTQSNKYGGNVTFRFHNMASKVRVAMYETVPGYTVTINSFKVADAANPAFSAMTTVKTTNFAANFVNCAAGIGGTLTVKYQSSGTTENHPTVSFAGTAANVLELGALLKANITIGESVTDATYDKAEKAYTSVFPKEDNTQNLKLKVCYTLTAPVTNETIVVNDATAEVPAEYLKWKPGFAYTYIFKITDDKLYPITFDAVEIITEDGLAEYITTVSEPSITTIGVKDSKYSVGNSDYDPSTDVYATVMDGSSLATLSASNFSIYDVSTLDATNFPITEASVAEALIEGPTWTKAQADNKKITCANGPGLTFQKNVPAEDGTTKTLDETNNKAAKFTTGTSGKKYALVYEKTHATYIVDGGNTYADETAFNNAGTLYTTAECTAVATWSDSSTTYYKRTAVSNKGVYAIKIVTVE